MDIHLSHIVPYFHQNHDGDDDEGMGKRNQMGKIRMEGKKD